MTTADDKTRAFWERNLRFMTDSGKDGPEKGAPAIMPAAMMGDRAAVIFAAPEEINKVTRCDADRRTVVRRALVMGVSSTERPS